MNLTKTEQVFYEALKAAGTANGMTRSALAQLGHSPSEKYAGAAWYASNAVDVHIKNLRMKLRTAGNKERVLSIRGFGYRLV